MGRKRKYRLVCVRRNENKSRITIILKSCNNIKDMIVLQCVNTQLQLVNVRTHVRQTDRPPTPVRNTAYRALDTNLAIVNKSRVSRAHHTLRTAIYRSQYFAPDV